MQKLARRRAAAGQQYAIVIGLIAVFALIGVARMGSGVSQMMTRTANVLSGVDNGFRAPSSPTAPQTVDATNCRTILNTGGSTGNGVYTVDPDGAGGDAAFSTYCDMTTDGGGWTLAGYSYMATATVSTFSASNKNMYGFACGGGSFTPTSRSGNSAAVKALALAKGSTEMALGIGGTVTTGLITAHSYAYKFTIPNPSILNFNDSGIVNNPSQGSCTAVSVTDLKLGGAPVTRYTYSQTLSAGWADSFPSFYGAASTSNCSNPPAGPLITNGYSGSGTNYPNSNYHNDCGANKGYYIYGHYGNRSRDGDSVTGDNSIWFR